MRVCRQAEGKSICRELDTVTDKLHQEIGQHNSLGRIFKYLFIPVREEE